MPVFEKGLWACMFEYFRFFGLGSFLGFVTSAIYYARCSLFVYFFRGLDLFVF